MNILEVDSVSKQYASHKALDKVSLTVPQGSIFGLLGPNGAGKTSLIRIITQITKPDSGRIVFNGEPLNGSHTAIIGYLPEERGLYKKMEVGEQLLYMAQLKGLSKQLANKELKTWIEKLEIGGWWNKKVEELSKGMQQKIQFIATVVHNPKLLILDEPFSGFDPINAELITREILALQKKGTSIIFSTHRMESVEQLCDHVALINQSQKVLDGNLQQLKLLFGNQSVLIEHTVEKLHLSGVFNLISTERTESGHYLSLVSNVSEMAYNQILTEVIEQGRVIRFEPHVPTMQDIFIKVVSGK